MNESVSTTAAPSSGSLFDKIGITGLVSGVTSLIPTLAPVALAKYQVDQANANLAAQQTALNAQLEGHQIAQQQAESGNRRLFVIGGVLLVVAIVLGVVLRRR